MTTADPLDRPQTFDVDPDTPPEPPPATEQPAEGADLPSVSHRTERWLIWCLGLTIGLAIVVDFAITATAAISAPTVSGILTAVLYAVVLALAGVLIGREFASLARLARLDHLRRGAALLRAARTDSDGLLDALVAHFARRRETAWSVQEARGKIAEVPDAADRLAVLERTVLTDLDEKALNLIATQARGAAVFTAISPYATIDMAVIAWRLATVSGGIMRIYGGRPGLAGTMRLTRKSVLAIAATGAIEQGGDMVASALGGDASAKLSRGLGQGLVSGLFVVRIGLAAMALCRPIPFTEDASPTASSVLRRTLRPLADRQNR